MLDYQVVVRMRDSDKPLDARIRLATTPPVATRNRVKRPRYVGWKLRALPGKGEMPPAAVLTRLENLLYLEAPTEGIIPKPGGMRFGNRFCRLWQARTPPSVGAFVYLVEVSPGLLALSYLSASLPEGDVVSLEITLDGVSMAPVPAPAEGGSALLRTLKVWGMAAEHQQQTMETEQIQ